MGRRNWAARLEEAKRERGEELLVRLWMDWPIAFDVVSNLGRSVAVEYEGKPLLCSRVMEAALTAGLSAYAAVLGQEDPTRLHAFVSGLVSEAAVRLSRNIRAEPVFLALLQEVLPVKITEILEAEPRFVITTPAGSVATDLIQSPGPLLN